MVDIAEEQGITSESAQQKIHKIRSRVKKQVIGFMDGRMGGIVSPQEKRCYIVKELQEILGISSPTVYKLLKKNEFSWIQIGTKYRILKCWG